jgi:hypothetical protein
MCIGLSGGIVKVDAECKTGGEHKKGFGATIYHSVDSIEEVRSITNPYNPALRHPDQTNDRAVHI